MNTPKKGIFQLVRGFLFKLLNKEFLIFLFFLALSSVFWLSMTLNDTLEKELSIPVVVTHVPKDVYITNAKDSTNLIDTLRVTLSDKGYTLASYIYGQGLAPIYLNYESIKNSGGHYEFSSSDLKRMLRSQLTSSTVIVSMKPEKVDVYYSHEKKEVGVQFYGRIKAADNYFITDTVIEPKTVTLFANSDIRSRYDNVQTEYASLTGLSEPVTRSVRLKPVGGSRLEPEFVNVTVMVDMLQDQQMKVPVTAVNVPADFRLITYPPKVEVKYVVASKKANMVRESDFRVSTDFQTIGDSPKCKLKVTCSNPNVKSFSLREDSVRCVKEQKAGNH